MPRGTQVKRDGLAIAVERRGISSGIALRHLSRPRLHVRSARDHTGGETALRGVWLSGVWLSRPSGLKVPGCPHTSSRPNYTWGTPGVNYCGGPIRLRYYFSYSLSCNWDSVLFSHEFLIVPESPSPLLGRDILSKAHASVFMNMEPSLSLPWIEQNVNPGVLAHGKAVGRAQNAISVVFKLKDRYLFPHKKQYPLKPEVKEGLKPIIENLKEQGLLVPCNSPCNTPILGIKKSNGKWRLVQDLQRINEAVVPLHPVVPNLTHYCLKFVNKPNISQ